MKHLQIKTSITIFFRLRLVLPTVIIMHISSGCVIVSMMKFTGFDLLRN
jgi:hypothetical protein